MKYDKNSAIRFMRVQCNPGDIAITVYRWNRDGFTYTISERIYIVPYSILGYIFMAAKNSGCWINQFNPLTGHFEAGNILFINWTGQ